MLENKTGTSINHLFNVEDIGEAIIESLMLNYDIDEDKATDIFFSSQIFSQLSEETTKLYERPWQEIYKMLTEELKM
jgi:hypothetical protein